MVSGGVSAIASVQPGFAVLRYLSNGTLDVAFGVGGRAVARSPQLGFADALVVQQDGKIVVGGWGRPAPDTSVFALIRWAADGTLDPSFGAGVVFTAFAAGRSDVNALALQTDGKVVAAGEAQGAFALARYLSNGALDATFGSGGTLRTVFPATSSSVRALLIQPDGRIVAAGDASGGGGYDARERAADILRKAQRGEDPKAEEAPGPVLPLSEVARRFREQAFPDLAASTRKEWGRLIDVEILPVLGTLDATDVRSARRQIRDATDAIKRRSPYTANRTWEVVRRMIGWGIERDFLDPMASAVFTNFPRPAEEKKRDRVLTHDEIRRAFAALRHEPPVTAIFWRLAFYTGQRRGEILGARWDAFELDRALWTFRTKGDKPHVLGLPRQVIAVLREAWPLSSHTP